MDTNLAVISGDLFDVGAEVLVNPVNTVGAMGAGLAKQFATRWPRMLHDYVRACRAGELQPGTVHAWRNPAALQAVPTVPHAADDRRWDPFWVSPRWIVNVPTKRHWRDPSRLADVEQGLAALAAWIEATEPSWVAVPALGCGLGGLPWPQVRDLSVNQLSGLPCRITVLEPAPTTGRH